MLFLKKFGKSFLYTLISLLVLSLIMTLLNYIGVIDSKFISFLKLFIPIISFFIGGTIAGKHSSRRAWLDGLKYGIIIILVMFVLNYLVFNNPFLMKHILFYLVLMISYVFGSMIGINLKKA